MKRINSVSEYNVIKITHKTLLSCGLFIFVASYAIAQNDTTTIDKIRYSISNTYATVIGVADPEQQVVSIPQAITVGKTNLQ